MRTSVRAAIAIAVGASVGALVAGAVLSYMQGSAPASPTLGTNPVAAQAAKDGTNAPLPAKDAPDDNSPPALLPQEENAAAEESGDLKDESDRVDGEKANR